MLKKMTSAFLFTASSVWLASSSASASVIQVDDLTETLTVTVDGVDAHNVPTVANLRIVGETVSFDYTSSHAVQHPGNYYFLMNGAVGSPEQNTVSDEGIFTAIEGSPVIGVQFTSDPDQLTVPPNSIFLGSFNETGAFQTVADRVSSSDLFQVRSDVETPEPGTLAIIGAALLSLIGLGMMRRRTDV